MPKYLINQGKGLLVEINHNDSAAIENGQILLFLPPRVQDAAEYCDNLTALLAEKGLRIGGSRIVARGDYNGRDEIAITYVDTLRHAKTAVTGYPHLVADPASLKEFSHRERVDLGEKHWRQKDEEWDNAVRAARPARTSGKQPLQR